MSRLFQKAQGGQRLFKKASGAVNGFFRKNGTLDRKVAGGLGSAAKAIREGVNAGSNIVGAVESSAFGSQLAPATAAARGALGAAGLIGNMAAQGKQMIRAAYKGKADQAVHNVLEKAKSIQNTANQISFH